MWGLLPSTICSHTMATTYQRQFVLRGSGERIIIFFLNARKNISNCNPDKNIIVFFCFVAFATAYTKLYLCSVWCVSSTLFKAHLCSKNSSSSLECGFHKMLEMCPFHFNGASLLFYHMSNVFRLIQMWWLGRPLKFSELIVVYESNLNILLLCIMVNYPAGFSH